MSAALYHFRESLFLLPALVVVGGLVAVEVAAAIDERIGTDRHVPATVDMNSNAATWLLSTVAGATITTAGVVFSLTVVSLQLASSQFSPRVMRSFIRDRLSQVVVGLLVGTFVYSVLALRHINAESAAPAPKITVTVTVVLTVTTVLLIIAHLNRLAHRLQVGEVVRSISGEGEEVLHALLRAGAHERPADDVPAEADADSTYVVPADRAGWVTQAPARLILRAVPPGTTVRLETRTGAFIHEGEALVTLWPAPHEPERVLRRLSATVEVADTRTMQQDVDFALRQLVDVGLRALSPAVNDPTTAVEASLRVGGLLRHVLVSDLPPEKVHGPEERVLLRPYSLRHDEYIQHGFDQLRQASPSQPHVVAALLRILRMLIQHVTDAGRPEHVPALRRQMRLLLEAVDEQPGLHPEDRERLRAIARDTTDPADHENPVSQSGDPQ
ncbi:DUF2254 domain-containing protein [Actinomadura sp. GC306]|nr:DUF2254 domain-containing protein [Actinomadura sp. GC306]